MAFPKERWTPPVRSLRSSLLLTAAATPPPRSIADLRSLTEAHFSTLPKLRRQRATLPGTEDPRRDATSADTPRGSVQTAPMRGTSEEDSSKTNFFGGALICATPTDKERLSVGKFVASEALEGPPDTQSRVRPEIFNGTSTANVLRNLFKHVPPLWESFVSFVEQCIAPLAA